VTPPYKRLLLTTTITTTNGQATSDTSNAQHVVARQSTYCLPHTTYYYCHYLPLTTYHLLFTTYYLLLATHDFYAFRTSKKRSSVTGSASSRVGDSTITISVTISYAPGARARASATARGPRAGAPPSADLNAPRQRCRSRGCAAARACQSDLSLLSFYPYNNEYP